MISQERIKKIKKSLKDFWVEYESKIALAIGMILVAILAFEAGILKGRNFQQEPLVIEKPAQIEAIAAEGQASPQTQNSALEGQKQAEAIITPQNPSTALGASCAFVGSKNSDKYHLPTCPYAKRIKPENIVCFSSAEDARVKGYQPDKSCIK